jgi:hypothetical protein
MGDEMHVAVNADWRGGRRAVQFARELGIRVVDDPNSEEMVVLRAREVWQSGAFAGRTMTTALSIGVTAPASIIVKDKV